MKRESAQIWAVDEAEARYYRATHLLVSALWDLGLADRALAVLSGLLDEVNGGPATSRAAPGPVDEGGQGADVRRERG